MAIFLFAVATDMGSAGAQGHLPVQGPDIVPLLVVTQLLEVETTATKTGLMATAQHAAAVAPRQQGKLPDQTL